MIKIISQSKQVFVGDVPVDREDAEKSNYTPDYTLFTKAMIDGKAATVKVFLSKDLYDKPMEELLSLYDKEIMGELESLAE